MNIYEEEDDLEQLNTDVSADDLELIQLVKHNPGLWNNSLKSYSKTDDKNMVWSLLGQNLSNPLSGSDAQKKFADWRTTFGRIYKKVLHSQPKSGSSSDHVVYMPTWPLYNELLFLKDVIKPRQTKSNFSNLMCAPAVKKSLTTQLNKPTVIPVLKRSQSSLIENEITKQPSSCTMSTLSQQNKLATSVDNSSFPISYNFQESPIFVNSFLSQTDVSDVGSVMSTVKKPEKIQPQKKIKVETPPPDSFYNKKKVKDDEDLKILKDMADSMRTMTTTFTTGTTAKIDMSQDSCGKVAETLNPEI